MASGSDVLWMFTKWIELDCQVMTQHLEFQSQWFVYHAPSALAKQLQQFRQNIHLKSEKKLFPYLATQQPPFLHVNHNMGVISRCSYLLLCFSSQLAPFLWSGDLMIDWNDKLEMAWRCLFCAGFSALMLASLLTHYNSEHDRFHEERPFHICCEIDSCTKAHIKVNSFTKHVRTVHRKFLWSTSPNDTAGEPCLLEGM